MFYILRTIDAPFASTPAETMVVARNVTAGALDAAMNEARRQYPSDTIEAAEVTFQIAPSVTIQGTQHTPPPELTRAVETWNNIAPRCTPPLPKIVKPERFVTAYRRWKRRATGRTMLLEDIVQLVENATWTHAWIRLGWLFGEKDGEMNYEKLLHRSGERRVMTPGKRAAGNGSDYEAVER